MGIRDRIRRWLAPTQQKSWTVQVLVGDDGFMASQSFDGGDLFTVYTQALWTFICAHRISQDMASFPAVVQERPPGTDAWTTSPGHDLNALLHRPYGRFAPQLRWNWRQQVAAGALRGELGGNQFFRAVKGNGGLQMLGLYLVELKATTDNDGYITMYNRNGYANDNIPPDEVVNVMHASPSSRWEGVPPTTAAEPAIRVDYAASRRIRYDLETRIKPGVVFRVKSLFAMTDEQRTKVETLLEDSFEGATKAGKSLVVGDNVDIEGGPVHQIDDVPSHHDNARDSIISAHDVSPPTVGVLRDARYQTWEQALRAQYTLCIHPRLVNLYDTVNSQAIEPVYGPDVRLWFDPVRSPLGLAWIRERAETAQKLLDLGYPANAVNEYLQLGMPTFEELERPNMPAVIAGREDLDGGATPDDEGGEQTT